MKKVSVSSYGTVEAFHDKLVIHIHPVHAVMIFPDL